MVQKYLRPIHVWAISLGCAVGWGAFVMPATTLLPIAGPAGTIIALVIGTLLLALIAANFHSMILRTDEKGGVFAYTKNMFGYDHSFLCVWLLVLAYISILWANATSFVLISRFLFGGIFQWGFHYTVAGYDVYCGEILLTLAVILFFGLVTMNSKQTVANANALLALFLVGGTVLCTVLVAVKHGVHPAYFLPGFADRKVVSTALRGGASDAVSSASIVAQAAVSKPHWLQILNIVVLAPWAFVGFEAVALTTGESTFSKKKSLAIMIFSLCAGCAVYIALSVLSVLVLPDGCLHWQDYIMRLSHYTGRQGLPTFYAAETALGKEGLVLLGLCVLSALSTSMLGLYRVSARLILALAEDDVLPAWFSKTTHRGLPKNALFFIMLLSAVIPFLGRTAIGWIVDVTTISASIVYLYICACVVKTARLEKNRLLLAQGITGCAVSALLFFFPLIPNLWNLGMLATESYLIFAAWSLIGFVIFHFLFQHDKKNRFGRSTAMWVSMLFLILFSSTMWTRQVVHDEAETAIENISNYHQTIHEKMHLPSYEAAAEKAYMEVQLGIIQRTLLVNSSIQMLLIIGSLVLMFNIFSILRRREKKASEEKTRAEEVSQAKTMFLSNMSHDIRTPMNAIIGYTTLAKKEGVTLDEMRTFLEKIDSSSKHLLALINDVLEMSRIENGKIEIEEVPCDLRTLMGDVQDMFATQMLAKGITFTVGADAVRHPLVFCDTNRLNRVLLNLISNALKFTPEKGSVTVTLSEQTATLAPASGGNTSAVSEGCSVGTYVLSVRDSGIGMSAEFTEKVFEAFERERTSTVSGVQGTGLGMTITKSIVDMMGGTIDVHTAQGEGTEFVVTLPFRIQTAEAGAGAFSAGSASATDALAATDAAIDFTKLRVLLVDDVDVNREIAVMLLSELGLTVETAVNGKEAVDKVAQAAAGYYSAVLMDIQMPVMDGYEATACIRALGDSAKASVPIVAMTANAFSEDVKKAHDAGMNAHVAKPIDMEKLTETLRAIMRPS